MSFYAILRGQPNAVPVKVGVLSKKRNSQFTILAIMVHYMKMFELANRNISYTRLFSALLALLTLAKHHLHSVSIERLATLLLR